jgi:hypothetical protein
MAPNFTVWYDDIPYKVTSGRRGATQNSTCPSPCFYLTLPPRKLEFCHTPEVMNCPEPVGTAVISRLVNLSFLNNSSTRFCVRKSQHEESPASWYPSARVWQGDTISLPLCLLYGRLTIWNTERMPNKWIALYYILVEQGGGLCHQYNFLCVYINTTPWGDLESGFWLQRMSPEN